MKAYDAGRCDAYTTDASGLAGERLRLAKPDDHIILPEIISKEPLGPAVRHGDDQWFDIVKWTHFAMVNAEELGITQANVDDQKKSDNPDIKRLLGTEGKHGEALGPDQRLGLSHHQARRQLRRGVRAQCRAGLAAEDRARAERAVEQGRIAIRAAGPLTCGFRPERRKPMTDGRDQRCRDPETESAAALQSEGSRHRLSGGAVRG